LPSPFPSQAEFLRLSLGFKCDWFTLEKRVKLEERSRDLAEENLKKEITNCLKLLEVRSTAPGSTCMVTLTWFIRTIVF
jgi:hypothetical protein